MATSSLTPKFALTRNDDEKSADWDQETLRERTEPIETTYLRLIFGLDAVLVQHIINYATFVVQA